MVWQSSSPQTPFPTANRTYPPILGGRAAIIPTIKARFVSPTCLILGEPAIGEGTWIGHFTILDAANAALIIGKNCSIASGVHIYTHSTHLQTTEGKPKLVAPVVIGDNVAIGANSVILHGCIIESGVCIPALTLLKPYTKVGKVESPRTADK